MRSMFLYSMSVMSVCNLGKGERVYSSVNPLRMQSNTTQCSDSDRNLWESSSSSQSQFFVNIESCSSQGAGSVDQTANVSSCLTQIYPTLSQSCAQCFGSDVDCGSTNCRVPCQTDSNSSECQACLTPCTNTLTNCTGTSNLPQSASSSGAGSLDTSTLIIALLSVFVMYIASKSPLESTPPSTPRIISNDFLGSVVQVIRMESMGVSDGSLTPPTRRFSTLSSFHSICSICVDSIPGWKLALGEDGSFTEKIKVKQLMEGLSNQLFKVSLVNVPSNAAAYTTVLFRIYGEHVSSFYDPEHELEVFRVISQLEIGPKMIANGPSWRIEEYYESIVLPVSSLGNPSTFCQIASQLGRLHKLNVPLERKDPIAAHRLDKWTNAGLQALKNLNLSEPVVASLGIDEIEREVQRMKSVLQVSRDLDGWNVVFSHNDVQENNILLTPYGMRLIDFEYADFNFQHADIGNFFNEFTMDYLYEGPGGFKGSPEKYPAEPIRRMFMSVYLSEYFQEPYLEDNGEKSEKISNFLRAAEIGSLLSHLLWGMWSLVRAQQQADTFGSFDFVNYAKFRFDSFTAKKHILDS